jgi:hypothetical protein
MPESMVSSDVRPMSCFLQINKLSLPTTIYASVIAAITAQAMLTARKIRIRKASMILDF